MVSMDMTKCAVGKPVEDRCRKATDGPEQVDRRAEISGIKFFIGVSAGHEADPKVPIRCVDDLHTLSIPRVDRDVNRC